MASILIMEPELRLGMKMCDILTHAGHQCRVAQSIPEGLSHAEQHSQMIVIINARLPWKESFSFLHTLEARQWPILFTTRDEANIPHLQAMVQSPCRVLMMPVETHALLSAVTDLSRLTGDLLTLGSLQLDLQAHLATKDGEALPLTAQEFALLHALMQSPSATLTREELLRTAWGYQTIGETRTVDVHIQRLRRKIGSSFIETVYKLGYRLKPA